VEVAEALALARQQPNQYTTVEVLLTLAGLHGERGETDRVRSVTREARSLAERHGFGFLHRRADHYVRFSHTDMCAVLPLVNG
jgi:hypothetical protein